MHMSCHTLAGGGTSITEDAGIRRPELLMPSGLSAVALAVDAAQSIGAADSRETMLAHQCWQVRWRALAVSKNANLDRRPETPAIGIDRVPVHPKGE